MGPKEGIEKYLELEEDEEVLYSNIDEHDHNWFDDIVIAVTDKRFISKPGKETNSFPNQLINQTTGIEIYLDKIESVRQEVGFSLYCAYIETIDEINQIPRAISREEQKEIIKCIVEAEDLVIYKEPSQEKKAAAGWIVGLAGAFGVSAAIMEMVIGAIFIFLGIMLSITVIGAILGVPAIIFGLWIMSASAAGGATVAGTGLAAGSEIWDNDSEWVRAGALPDEVGESSPDDEDNPSTQKGQFDHHF